MYTYNISTTKIQYNTVAKLVIAFFARNAKISDIWSCDLKVPVGLQVLSMKWYMAREHLHGQLAL